MSPVPWSTLVPEQCELFVSVLILREFPEGHRRRPSSGDGGLDVIVPVDPAQSIYDVYQIKYFFSNLTSRQKKQIEESADATKKSIVNEGITIRQWHLTMPLDPTREQESWLNSLFADVEIQPYWKGLSYLEGLCAKLQDVVDYYINNSKDRIEGILDRAMSLIEGFRDLQSDRVVDFEAATAMAAQLFDRLNGQDRDPHYRYDMAIEGEKPDLNKFLQPGLVMSQWTAKTLEGPFVVFNVLARYKQAPEDRPIRGNVRLNTQGNQSVAQAIEDFRIYGSSLSLGAEYAEVATEDPLTPAGGSEYLPSAIEISGIAPPPDEERQRLVISGSDGRELRRIVVEVVERSIGPSGLGARVKLQTLAKSLTFDWRTRVPDADHPTGLTNFNVSTDWTDRIAAEVLEDVKFVATMKQGNNLAMGRQYGGPNYPLVTFDAPGERLPQWLEGYCESLAALQDYADAPLRLKSPDSDDDVLDIRRAIALGEMVRGVAPARQIAHGYLLEPASVEEVISAIERDGGIILKSVVISSISDATITIPDVNHVLSGIKVTERSGDQIVIGAINGDTFEVVYTLEDDLSTSPE